MQTVKYFDEILRKPQKNKILQFQNCRLFRGEGYDEDFKDLYVQNGRVVDAEYVFFTLKRKADIQIDCNGLIIAPGFIDIQVNGIHFIIINSLYI